MAKTPFKEQVLGFFSMKYLIMILIHLHWLIRSITAIRDIFQFKLRCICFLKHKKRNCSMPCELTTSVDSVRPHNVEPPFSGTCSVLSMEASFAAEIFKTLRSKIENDSILDFSSSNSNWLKQLSCFNKTHYGNSSIKLETSNAS